MQYRVTLTRTEVYREQLEAASKEQAEFIVRNLVKDCEIPEDTSDISVSVEEWRE